MKNLKLLLGALLGIQTVEIVHGCGGSLVAPEFVVTAQHCNFEPDDWAYVGALCDPYTTGDNCGQSAVRWVQIDTTFDKPGYSWPRNDITLLKLKERIDTIPIVAMDSGLSPSYPTGKSLWVAGMGNTIGGVYSPSPDLLEYEHSYIQNSACTGWTATADILCVASTGDGSCNGDSGGPLMDKANNVLAGVVTGGASGCGSSIPKIYNRVAEHYDWLVETICDNHSDPKPAYCVDDDDDPGDDGSCMSGETGLIKSNGDVAKLIELRQNKDKIKGYNAKQQLVTTCKVKAIGGWGTGALYGNYTSDHYIFDEDHGGIVQHGETGEMTREAKYEILTTCPLNEDESGTMFTPLDSDFCGSDVKEMSWADYVLLHRAVLRLVSKVGPFYFSSASYVDFSIVQELAPAVCRTMLDCMKARDPNECEEFEQAAVEFMQSTLVKKMQRKTMKKLPNIGKHTELFSATATILNRK